MDTVCYEVDNHKELFQRTVTGFCDDEVEKVMSIMWAIWRACNQVVCQDTSGNPARVIYSIAYVVTDWKEFREPSRWTVQSTVSNKWHPPPVAFYKINVDASSTEEP